MLPALHGCLKPFYLPHRRAPSIPLFQFAATFSPQDRSPISSALKVISCLVLTQVTSPSVQFAPGFRLPRRRFIISREAHAGVTLSARISPFINYAFLLSILLLSARFVASGLAPLLDATRRCFSAPTRHLDRTHTYCLLRMSAAWISRGFLTAVPSLDNWPYITTINHIIDFYKPKASSFTWCSVFRPGYKFPHLLHGVRPGSLIPNVDIILSVVRLLIRYGDTVTYQL